MLCYEPKGIKCQSYCCSIPCLKGLLVCLQYILELSCFNPHVPLTHLHCKMPIPHSRRLSVHVWNFLKLCIQPTSCQNLLDIYNSICSVIYIYFSLSQSTMLAYFINALSIVWPWHKAYSFLYIISMLCLNKKEKYENTAFWDIRWR